MGRSVAHKLIEAHLLEGDLTPGTEIALRIDQTLTQDATGTLVMLELEAMGLDRVQNRAVGAVRRPQPDPADFHNPDDHLFLRSACRRFGVWYSRAGNGVSHPVTHGAFRRAGQDVARRRQSHAGGRVARRCWPSAPAASRWRWPWRASRST